MNLLKSYDAFGTYTLVFDLPGATDMYSLVSMARRMLDSRVLSSPFVLISSSKTGEVGFFNGGEIDDICRFDMVSLYGGYQGVRAGVGLHFYEDRTPALSVSVSNSNRSSCFLLSKDIALALKGRLNAFREEADALCVPADHRP